MRVPRSFEPFRNYFSKEEKTRYFHPKLDRYFPLCTYAHRGCRVSITSWCTSNCCICSTRRPVRMKIEKRAWWIYAGIEITLCSSTRVAFVSTVEYRKEGARTFNRMKKKRKKKKKVQDAVKTIRFETWNGCRGLVETIERGGRN